MLKLNVNQKREPLGGHHYPEYGTVFKGASFTEVVRELTNFRINNSIPIGFPEQDVLQFYAKNWPYMVREDRDAKPPEQLNHNYLAWRDWMHRVWRLPPGKMISGVESSERTKICQNCPYNLKMSWGNGIEASELAKRRFLLLRGYAVPSNVGFCGLHKVDIGISSFIDQPAVFSKKTEGESPANCWVK